MRTPRSLPPPTATRTVDPSDQWIGTDGNGTPAIITYIHGPLSLQPTSVTLSGGDVQWTYNITVAAGATVSLAYFTIVATTSTAADGRGQRPGRQQRFRRPGRRLPERGELQSLANFANPAPVLTPPPSPTEGTAISNATLFHFYDTSANANLSNYTATIAWGDGNVSTVTSTASSGGQIVADANGGYDVLGSHVYTEATSARSRSASRSATARARSLPATAVSPCRRAADGRRLDHAGGHRAGVSATWPSSTSATPIRT